MFYFLLKVNMVTFFCTSDRKAVAFSSLQLYIAKLIAGLTIKYVGFTGSCAHDTQISKTHPMWHGRY